MLSSTSKKLHVKHSCATHGINYERAIDWHPSPHRPHQALPDPRARADQAFQGIWNPSPGLHLPLSAAVGNVWVRLNFCIVSSKTAFWAISPVLWRNDLKRQQQPSHVCRPWGELGCCRESTKHPLSHLPMAINAGKTGAVKDENLVPAELKQLLILISTRSRFHSQLQSAFLCKKLFYI